MSLVIERPSPRVRQTLVGSNPHAATELGDGAGQGPWSLCTLDEWGPGVAGVTTRTHCMFPSCH